MITMCKGGHDNEQLRLNPGLKLANAFGVIPTDSKGVEMNIESLRDFCRELPAVTEDVKWGHDLCFSVAGKMFCVAALDGPLTVSFKVKDDEFDELSNSPGIRPAPYVARYKWVLVEDVDKLSRKEWAHYVKQSYDLVRAKLPKKVAREHGLS